MVSIGADGPNIEGGNELPSKSTSPVAAKTTFSKRHREFLSGSVAE
jgi:hypothetical protein